MIVVANYMYMYYKKLEFVQTSYDYSPVYDVE